MSRFWQSITVANLVTIAGFSLAAMPRWIYFGGWGAAFVGAWLALGGDRFLTDAEIHRRWDEQRSPQPDDQETTS